MGGRGAALVVSSPDGVRWVRNVKFHVGTSGPELAVVTSKTLTSVTRAKFLQGESSCSDCLFYPGLQPRLAYMGIIYRRTSGKVIQWLHGSIAILPPCLSIVCHFKFAR